MRTITEIKEAIEADFMANAAAADRYGFEVGADFNSVFNRVSVESILFYVFACAAYVMERLFTDHKADVEERIELLAPHRALWYRNKVLEFMVGKTLVEDTDQYDTSNMTEEDIAAARVVKHATANEDTNTSVLTIKVAGETGGVRSPLAAAVATQLSAYIAEVKDAGVKITLVNQTPDVLNCTLDIYYNPLLTAEEVQTACRAAIDDYVANLPFNGEFTPMALVNVLQAVEGVKVVSFTSATAQGIGDSEPVQISGRYTPAAGYFTAGTVSLNMVAYV